MIKRGFFLLFLVAVVAQTQSMKIKESGGAAWPIEYTTLPDTKLDDCMLLLKDEPKNDEIFGEVNRRKEVRDNREQLQRTKKKSGWPILGFVKSAVFATVLLGVVEATGFEQIVFEQGEECDCTPSPEMLYSCGSEACEYTFEMLCTCVFPR